MEVRGARRDADQARGVALGQRAGELVLFLVGVARTIMAAAAARLAVEQLLAARDHLAVTGRRANRGEPFDIGRQCVGLRLVEADPAKALHGRRQAIAQRRVAAIPLEGVRTDEPAGEERGLELVLVDPPGQAIRAAIGMATRAGERATL